MKRGKIVNLSYLVLINLSEVFLSSGNCTPAGASLNKRPWRWGDISTVFAEKRDACASSKKKAEKQLKRMTYNVRQKNATRWSYYYVCVQRSLRYHIWYGMIWRIKIIVNRNNIIRRVADTRASVGAGKTRG